MKPIICLDLDDTLADSAPTIISFAQKCDVEQFNGTGTLKKISNNMDHYYFARMLNWTTDQLVIFFDNYYLKYLKEIKPMESASKITKKLKQLGFEIHIVTSRIEKENNIVENLTNNWLLNNNISFDKLVIGKINKGNYVRKVNAKYFIDDSLEHCLNAKKKSPSTKVFLMENQFNCNIKENIEKVNNLSNLYNRIKIDMRGEN